MKRVFPYSLSGFSLKKANMRCLKITLLLVLFHCKAKAQYILSPQLIGTTGGYVVVGNYSLSFSCGETIIPTETSINYILTQGFQQPSETILGLNSTAFVDNVSCAGANNGQIRIVPSGGSPPYNYSWSTGDSTASITGLEPGTYTYTLTDAAGLTYVDSLVIIDGNGICDLHIYTGITPNADGENDFWFIGSIDLHLPNTVVLYNRWGVEIWSGKDYDNTAVRWEGLDRDGNQLPSGTYYYIIQADNKTMKGWVELSR
jgi:gliding motility-associated-like protein